MRNYLIFICTLFLVAISAQVILIAACPDNACTLEASRIQIPLTANMVVMSATGNACSQVSPQASRIGQTLPAPLYCRDDCARAKGSGWACNSRTCQCYELPKITCSSGIYSAMSRFGRLSCVDDCPSGTTCSSDCKCVRNPSPPATNSRSAVVNVSSILPASCSSGRAQAGQMCSNDCPAGQFCSSACRCVKLPIVILPKNCSKGGALGANQTCRNDCGPDFTCTQQCKCVPKYSINTTIRQNVTRTTPAAGQNQTKFISCRSGGWQRGMQCLSDCPTGMRCASNCTCVSASAPPARPYAMCTWGNWSSTMDCRNNCPSNMSCGANCRCVPKVTITPPSSGTGGTVSRR